MIRSLIFFLIVVIDTVIFASGAVIVGIFNPYSKIIHGFIMRTWSKILLIFAGVKVTVTGLENIEKGKSYIVVSNHQSNMDIPVLDAHLPLYITFIAKKELFKIPFFGWGLRGAGMLKIDRSDHTQAIKTLREAERTIFKHGLSVLAFPEGTRSMDGKIHAFKKGPFIMAINTGIPLLPVTIKGTYHILPKKGIRIKPGPAKIIIHPPVSVENYTIENRAELVDKVHKIIVEAFHE